jgi:hypothetical protein
LTLIYLAHQKMILARTKRPASNKPPTMRSDKGTPPMAASRDHDSCAHREKRASGPLTFRAEWLGSSSVFPTTEV